MLASSMVVGAGLAAAGAAYAEGGNNTNSPNTAGALAKLGALEPGKSGEVRIGDETVTGGLFAMTADDGKTNLETYCIDLHHFTKTGSEYRETGWASTSLAQNKDSGKILWILQNSYPQKPAGDLFGKFKLTPAQAAAATQAAIWHFSDGVTAKPVDEAAAGLTDYLVKNAQTVEEPKPTLTLSPASAAGKSGDLLGPITVNTTGDSVQLALDADAAKAGVALTDKTGKPVSTAKNGDQVFGKTAAGANAGNATLTATTSTKVQVGRAFTSLGYTPDKHSQTMILAGSDTTTVSATAKLTWAPTGPVPSVTSAVDCKQGALVITVGNKGDQPWTFPLNGTTITVKPGETKSIPVQVGEGKSYDITITGPNGFSQHIQGVLKCKTDTGSSPSPTPSGPASATPSATPSGGPGLAFTGGGSETPVIAGLAGVLMIAGAGAIYAVRRRGRHSRTSA